jgi:hypothetical protein
LTHRQSKGLVQRVTQPSRTRAPCRTQLAGLTLTSMALPPEPASGTSDASSAPDPGDIDAELEARVENLYWECDDWIATRSDDVKLFSILASGSGQEWQRRVREARQNGQTLSPKDFDSGQERPH